MHILIIEDEEPAAIRLKKLLLDINPSLKISGSLDSVRAAVEWLKSHSAPDLILMDIQLADGISFEIFENIKITCPVIFTTAYDQYAIKAFKLNSVDYLLKPLNKGELTRALEKYKNLYGAKKNSVIDYEKLLNEIKKSTGEYQKRIVIRYGEIIKTVEIEDAAYFYTEDKINFVRTKQNQSYPVDYNLDELEKILNPKLFYRINRQFIVHISSIEKMRVVSKSRVKLTLNPSTSMETIVSTERSGTFKNWLSGV